MTEKRDAAWFARQHAERDRAEKERALGARVLEILVRPRCDAVACLADDGTTRYISGLIEDAARSLGLLPKEPGPVTVTALTRPAFSIVRRGDETWYIATTDSDGAITFKSGHGPFTSATKAREAAKRLNLLSGEAKEGDRG